MWLPQSAVDIERAVEAGLFRKTPPIDAKAEPGSAKSVAIDVAATSTGGGVIVYGVREPDAKDGKRFVPSPIDLTGRRDWIDSIVKTSIDPVPYFEVLDFESTADADVGYLVVVVPKSDAAPHMMVSGGDNRFYSRSATGNCR